MTLNNVKEYAREIRKRYLKATKKEKSQILSEFVTVTGYHRKAVIKLLLNTTQPTGHHRGRTARCSKVLEPLKASSHCLIDLCRK